MPDYSFEGLYQFILTPSVWESTYLPTHVLVACFTKLLDFCQSDNVILICIYLVLSCIVCLIYLKAFAFPFFFCLWFRIFLSCIFLCSCCSFKNWFNKTLYIGRLNLCLWYELLTTLPHFVIYLLKLIMIYLSTWSCRGAF